MKNIAYLVRSTRWYKQPIPLTYVGATNYLHRELLIHNHEWHPNERERRRNPITRLLQKKLFYKPFAVVTGFSEEKDCLSFVNLFKKDYKSIGDPIKMLKYNSHIIDPIEFQVRQLSAVTQDFYANTLLQRDDFKQLTVHWHDMESLRYAYNLPFPPDVNHIDGINVSAIDAENYDPLDRDDDRNWSKFKSIGVEEIRRDNYVRIARELKVDPGQVPEIMHQSRVEMKKNLQNKGRKVAKKAEKYVHLVRQRQSLKVS